MSVHGSLGTLKPAEFARAGEKITGTVQASALSRLREQMPSTSQKEGKAGQDGRVNYAVAGGVTERGHDALSLQLSGAVELICQRCLEPVTVTVESSRRIIFAENAEVLETQYDAEDSDAVEPEAELDIATLIEDEILLSLPLAPMHDAGVCQAAISEPLPARMSPFAALAGLTRKPGDE